MSRDRSRHAAGKPVSTDSLCMYEECRFCMHRINAYRTPDGEGQCRLELEGKATVSMCRGKLFFSPSPDQLGKYKGWILSKTSHAHT